MTLFIMEYLEKSFGSDVCSLLETSESRSVRWLFNMGDSDEKVSG